jgi:hypothetical protein
LSLDARSSQRAKQRAAPNQHARAGACEKIPNQLARASACGKNPLLVPACIASEGRSFGNWIVTTVTRLRVARESCRGALVRCYFLHL